METVYSQNDFRSYSELYHSQRLGAKWGVRHGPPYPLGKGQLTAAYKRNGGLSESAAERDGEEPGRKRPTKAELGLSFRKPTKEELEKRAAKEAQKADKKSRSSLFDKMKAAKAKRDQEKAAKIEADAAAKKKAEKEANLAKARDAKLEKARLEAADKEKREKFQKEIDEAIATGNKQWVQENFAKLSNEQIQAAVDRINLNKNLSNAGPKEKDGFDKLKDISDKVSKVRNFVEDGTKTWNTIVKINNSLNTNFQLPLIKDPFSNNNTPDAKEEARKKRIKEIIQSGDAKKIRDNLKDMTSNEVKEASERLSNINSINKNIKDDSGGGFFGRNKDKDKDKDKK